MALTAKKVYAILKRQISDMEAKLNSPVRYRGTVATADLLPLNPDIGDMYNIGSKSVYGEAGMNVAWNGVVWDTMGAPIDMSLYIKSSELADWVKQQNKPTYTAEEVGALPDTTVIPSKTSDLQNDSGFLTKIPDNYLSETDKTLSVSGKAADAKATGDKITELSADISNKLNKNQGSENSGKIAGINESGDIVPMFPVSVDYNEETNCLEFGSDQKMELNKGINLDSTLTKTGYAADAGAVGEITNSLKDDLSNIIQDQYEILINKRMNVILGEFEKGSINADGSNQDLGAGNLLRTKKYIKLYPVPYTFKTINGNGLAIFIYDSNGIFLRAEFMAATMGERSRTITFLETDYKCRIVINSYNNDYENYPVKAENIESIIIDISATKKSKTICCIGDSFTASTNSWHTYIRNRMGYNMINLGVAGTRISVSYTSGSKKYTSFIERVENGVLDAYTPDLIIVFGGINDTVKLHNAQMTIGTINDSAEYSPTKTSGYSFIGRVKYLIELIKSKKPGVPILGVIPPNYSEGTSNFEWWSEDISQIQSALRLVYEFYGIPYVDIKKNCQEMYEDSYNLATYRIDGRSNMHPSDKGYEAISVRIQKDGIENILIN